MELLRSGEMDIDEFNVYPFYYNANFTFSVAQSLFSLDKQFFLRVSVPNGFKINNQDTVVMIPLTEMGDKEQTLRLFDTIYLQSTEFVTCGQYDIKWQTVFKEKNCSEDIYSILNDEEYLDSLIQKYWFITEDVKNEKIYYSLEGYLFPNTYEFFIDEVSVKEIFNKMLDEMEKQLKPYKEDIEKSKYSIHELLTMASIVELEGKSISDRNEVAGVFYNRLKSNNTLGSDVTTYYGAKVNMSDRDLYQKEINTANDYNTRNASLAGKLPIGPICNPSISSIKAALYPKETNNYYFVADKNGKTYFTKTYNEHLRTVSKLKSEGLWYTY